MYKISQRRYLGNKNSMLGFIDHIIKKEVGDFDSFCDLFAGTGVVGAYFNTADKKIILNDLMYQNFVSLNAFLGADSFDEVKIKSYIKEFNASSISKENYFSKNFAGKYFSEEMAKKIGFIREEIERLFLSKHINLKEKQVLLSSLNYSVDRIANTVGHYDAFIKEGMRKQKLELKMLHVDAQKNQGNEVYNMDANMLIKEIECDVLYLDPPYNSRQYCDAYHLLENLSLWHKPEVFGVAKKFDRSKIKSDYCKNSAAKNLDELIVNANCKYILLSYNNMGERGNARSNAKISDEEIMKSLSKRGEVKIFEQDYKAFHIAKNIHGENKERVFFVEVS